MYRMVVNITEVDLADRTDGWVRSLGFELDGAAFWEDLE